MNFRRLARRASRAASAFHKPTWAPTGHYYSPVAGDADVKRASAAARARPVEVPGVDLDLKRQIETFERVALFGQRLPDARHTPGWRYTSDNTMLGLADATVLHGMLWALQPKRFIEIGSGYSSAVALDWATMNPTQGIELTFVEPYTERLKSLMRSGDQDIAKIIEQPVQDVPVQTFTQLARNDILFIDSTHISKAGSDVNYLFFEVLPRLAPGVMVHVHDVFWPFEYPERWLLEARSWNEIYLLRAWLIDNPRTRISIFTSQLWEEAAEAVAALMPEATTDQPGGIWIEIQ